MKVIGDVNGEKLKPSPMPGPHPAHGGAVGVLDLDPIPQRSGPVGRTEPLRHDALKPELTGG